MANEYSTGQGEAVVEALRAAGVPLHPLYEIEPDNTDIQLDPAGWRDRNPYRGWAATCEALWVGWRESVGGWYLLPFYAARTGPAKAGAPIRLNADDPRDIAAAMVASVFPKGVPVRR
jgi:hypothetical protein